MTTILGIDPGLDGAVAVLTEAGELVAVHDMPSLADGAKGRRTVNAPLLATIVFQTHATRAFCELVGPRPGEGAVGAFGFGRTRGVIEGVLAAAGIPLAMIAPPTWKRASNIAPGKENKDSARSVAINRWPSQAALLRPQARLRPRRGGFDRARRAVAREEDCRVTDDPKILVPFDREEAVPVRIMARLAGISEQTARNWCAEHGLGRRIGGRWWGSRVALAMFQDGDKAALKAYHAGQRGGRVADYFARVRTQKLKNLQSAQCSSGVSESEEGE